MTNESIDQQQQHKITHRPTDTGRERAFWLMSTSIELLMTTYTTRWILLFVHRHSINPLYPLLTQFFAYPTTLFTISATTGLCLSVCLFDSGDAAQLSSAGAAVQCPRHTSALALLALLDWTVTPAPPLDGGNFSLQRPHDHYSHIYWISLSPGTSSVQLCNRIALICVPVLLTLSRIS